MIHRVEILRKFLETIPTEKDVNVEYLAANSDNFSAADLENLCQEAAMHCLRENINNSSVSKLDFVQALQHINKQKGRLETEKVNLQQETIPLLFNPSMMNTNITLNNISFNFK